jgi:hypothetical protein
VVATFEEVVEGVMVVEEEGVVGVVAAAVDSGRRGGEAASATASTSPSMSATKRVGINSRGAKMNEVRPSSAMNETRNIGGGRISPPLYLYSHVSHPFAQNVFQIDFTLAPTDACLSRCYQTSERNNGGSSSPPSSAALLLAAAAAVAAPPTSSQSHSLTRALNTASNRAVRRILLSRSWPSAEALNLSLRAVLMRQREREEAAADAGTLARKGGGRRRRRRTG